MADFLEYAYLQRALLAGLMVAVICPAVGLYLVLRRFAQIGDALSHLALAGIAGGMLVGAYPTAVGLGFSVAASLGMDRIRESYKRYSELSVAIVQAAATALAIILMSKTSGAADILSYLFGAIMTVTTDDLYLFAGMGGLVVLFLVLFYKELLSVTFDEELARINGLPVRLLNTLMIAVAAATMTLSMRVVGVMLVSALVVVPAATALQLAKSFRGALAISVGVGLISVLIGIVSAHLLDLAPGGTVVLVSVLILLSVLAYKRIRGLE